MMSVKHNQIDLNADAASIDRENEVDTPVSGDSQAETLEGFSSCQGEVQDNVLDKVRICGSSEVICDLNIDADDVVMSSVGVGREVIVSDSVTDVEKDNECFGGEVGVEAGECIDRCGDDVSMCDDNKAESADVVEKASGEGVNHHMNGGPVGGVLEQWNHITGNSSSSHQDAGQSPTHKSEKVTSDGLENQVMEIDAQAEYNDDQLVDIHVSEVEISSDVMNESYGISLEVDLNACGTTSRDLTDMSIKLIASKQDFCASDLVWGKVRSHPWWPGQILAPSAASKKARKYFKKDSYLIAYFGDQTFAWNEASKIKPFREHFTQMESQSSLEDFHCAIDCALEEVSRRVEFGLSCSCIPEEALTEISTQMIVNAGVKEESSIIDGGDNYSSAASFDPVKLFEHVKALAQLLHYSGVDRLSLVTVQAQLSAFYRWKGYLQLPEFNVLGGLLDSDAEIPLSAEVKHGAEVLENAAPDFKHDKQEYCGTGKSNSQDGFSHKWMQISGDRACPRKKEKSLSDLLAESHTNMSNGKNGSDGKGDKLISSSSARKRKAVDSTYYDIAAKHKKLDSISEDKILKHKRGDRLIVKHGKSDLSSRADNSLPTKNLGVGTSILKIASQLNGSSGDQTSPKTLVKNKRNDKSDLRKSQRKMHFVAEDSSIDDFLSKLCLVARDPTTRYIFSISLVSFFSKFRKSVSLEISEGEGSGDRNQKMLKQSETAGIPASNLIKDSYWTDRVIENIPEVQQPLENKNEVEEALHNDPSQINISPLEAQLAVHLGTNMESGRQSDDENLEWESVNDGENLELKAVQPVDHLDGCCDEDVSPTALILNFSDSESVPSKEHLNKIFGHFGALNELETELLKSRRAKVVFKKRKDAEAAFSSAGKYSIFGPALVSYCLKYMSSASNASSCMTTKRSRKVATSMEGDAS
ncbi:uncharacterized protein LOC123202281 [Mangifera indica]|uniref:uncharacterized protein LOC123202281 n=1 Tax=Mangifera indica TaxID=29780 RepID=UPI001CFAFF3C|nr:uncharacterized protein LOC123202281 [Mangifera indica]